MCHCHIKHSFVCTGWGQHTQRGQQLRVYLCIWAGQEVFPPWLTQADGVSQLWDCELSLVMSGLCLALASFFTRHWTEVEQGCWMLPCGVFSCQVGLCHCLWIRGAVASSQGRRMRLGICILQCWHQGVRSQHPYSLQERHENWHLSFVQQVRWSWLTLLRLHPIQS